jgi:rubredoxin
MNYEEWVKAGYPHWKCKKCGAIYVTIPIDDEFLCPMCRRLKNE